MKCNECDWTSESPTSHEWHLHDKVRELEEWSKKIELAARDIDAHLVKRNGEFYAAQDRIKNLEAENSEWKEKWEHIVKHRPEWEQANCTQKHRIRELEAERNKARNDATMWMNVASEHKVGPLVRGELAKREERIKELEADAMKTKLLHSQASLDRIKELEEQASFTPGTHETVYCRRCGDEDMSRLCVGCVGSDTRTMLDRIKELEAQLLSWQAGAERDSGRIKELEAEVKDLWKRTYNQAGTLIARDERIKELEEELVSWKRAHEEMCRGELVSDKLRREDGERIKELKGFIVGWTEKVYDLEKKLSVCECYSNPMALGVCHYPRDEHTSADQEERD